MESIRISKFHDQWVILETRFEIGGLGFSFGKSYSLDIAVGLIFDDFHTEVTECMELKRKQILEESQGRLKKYNGEGEEL